MFKIEEMFKICSKTWFLFQFSGSILKSDRVFGVRMVECGCSYHSRANGKIPFQSPGKLSISTFFSIFPLVPP